MALSAAIVRVAAGEAEFSAEGEDACLDCHDTPYVMGIQETVHFDFDDPRAPAAQKQCQSCHGPSKVHMEFPMQVANVHFGKKSGSKPEVQNQMCLDCHGTGPQKAAWRASAHGYENVVCSACHGMHQPDKIVPTQVTLSTGCQECHKDLFGSAATTDFSHAVGKRIGDDGTLTCAGCHNPHGPLHSDRCLDCHPQTPELQAQQSAKARRYHEVAARRGTECMRCHKGIAHPIEALMRLEAGSPAPPPGE